MRTKLFMLALMALISTGCAGYRFYTHPTVSVAVRNNCLGSILEITSAYGEKAVIAYGGLEYITMEQKMGRDDRMLLTAEGRDEDGNYLGETSERFRARSGGIREEPWSIDDLDGGIGCEPIPRRAR